MSCAARGSATVRRERIQTIPGNQDIIGHNIEHRHRCCTNVFQKGRSRGSHCIFGCKPDRLACYHCPGQVSRGTHLFLVQDILLYRSQRGEGSGIHQRNPAGRPLTFRSAKAPHLLLTKGPVRRMKFSDYWSGQGTPFRSDNPVFTQCEIRLVSVAVRVANHPVFSMFHSGNRSVSSSKHSRTRFLHCFPTGFYTVFKLVPTLF